MASDSKNKLVGVGVGGGVAAGWVTVVASVCHCPLFCCVGHPLKKIFFKVTCKYSLHVKKISSCNSRF